MKKLAVDIASALLKMFYAVCRIFPVRNQWVLISRQSDDAPVDFKMIADWCQKQLPPIKTTILAKQLHNPIAYIPEMLRQAFYIATSKAVILDSYCIVVSLLGDTIKAPVVQIWHALGNMKKFGYASFGTDEGRSPETANLMRMHKGYDAIAVSSLEFRDDFAAGFDADPSILFEAPLPRADLLVDPESRQTGFNAVMKRYPQLKDKLNILYCPTFRKEESANAHEAIGALIDAVDHSKYNLIYKPHPVSDLEIKDPRVVTIAGNDPDALYVADYVISDYSTIIYEGGLLEVPVYLFAYDWNSYKEKRGMNIDLENDVPTLFTDDANKIIDAIENDDFDMGTYGAFVQENIALPENVSCTENLCRHIQEMER